MSYNPISFSVVCAIIVFVTKISIYCLFLKTEACSEKPSLHLHILSQRSKHQNNIRNMLNGKSCEIGTLEKGAK